MIAVRINKSHFNAGVVDVGLEGEIIKRIHLDEGLYLSVKVRVCSWKSAASFDTKEEAEWIRENPVKRAQYKLEVIEYTCVCYSF